MAEYRRGAHTVFDIHLHLVWITKYRRPALQGEVATRVRDLIRDICGQPDVAILKGHVSKDHVHLLVSIPPQTTISRLMQWLKGRTAHHLLAEFPHLKKQFGAGTCEREGTSVAVPATSRTRSLPSTSPIRTRHQTKTSE